MMPAVPSDDRDDHPQADLQFRQRRIDQHQRAEEQSRHAADGEHAEARDLDLEDQQRDPEQDQHDARVADRQHLQREERQQQADAAGDTRENAPGFQNSTVRPSSPSVSSM